MKLYVYNKNTKELVGTIEAQLDQLTSAKLKKEIYLIPPQATPFPPLEAKEGEVNVFNEEKGIWELVEDNRGLEVFDKKGNSVIIEELGAIPSGYSKTKPFIIQKERANLVNQVNLAYSNAQDEDVTIDNFTGNLKARARLVELQDFIGENEFGSYDSPNGTSVILTRDEMKYISKYLYVRSILLSLRKNEILKEVKAAKNKKQIEKIEIDFNVLKETKKLADKTDEEISTHIREKLK